MAKLKIKVEDIPGLERALYVITEGEIGPAGAPVFAARLEAAVKDGATTMLLDLAGVTYMNSTALASLLKLEDQIHSGYLGLVAVQDNAKIVMDNLGITGLFHVHDTREEAIEAARKELAGDGETKPEPIAEEEDLGSTTETGMLFHPGLSISGHVYPGNRILIDLTLRQDEPEPGVISGGVRLKDLAPDWTEVAVLVKLRSDGLSFGEGGDEGVVMLRRGEKQVRCTLVAKVESGLAPGSSLKIDATYRCNGSVRGSAHREILIITRA